MIEYEKGFEFPLNLNHRVELEDGNSRKVEYAAFFKKIRLEGTKNVRCEAVIQKCIITPRPDRRKFNWRRLRFETVAVAPKKELVWSFETDGLPYIIHNGKITGATESHHTKGDILGKAATAGVLLTSAFLVELIGPMERELLRLQRIVERHGLEIAAA